MNFRGAFVELEQGNKVRRTKWRPNAHLIMELNRIWFVDVQGDRNGGLEADMIDAKDWEVYEGDTWNLNKSVGMNNEITIDDCKKLKEKILEDMKTLNNEEFNYEQIENILDERFGF